MAIMYPKILPESVRQHPFLKNGEVKVYDALSLLSDEFHVYYDAWASTDNSVTAYDSPIDFIVIHKNRGLLGIEVKGGKIQTTKNGHFEQWKHSKKRWETIYPHAQIKEALRKIIKVLKSDGRKVWIPSAYCVLFPNTESQLLKSMAPAFVESTLGAEVMPVLADKITVRLSFEECGQSSWEKSCYPFLLQRLHNVPKENQFNWGKRIYKKTKDKVGRFVQDNPVSHFVAHVARHFEESSSSVFDQQEDTRPKTRSAYEEKRHAQHLAKMNHHPVPHDVREKIETKTQKLELDLKWWGVLLLAFTLVATFLVVSWFMPNSFLRQTQSGRELVRILFSRS